MKHQPSCVSTARPSDVAKARTSASGRPQLARPAARAVRTSYPRRCNSATTASLKFSSLCREVMAVGDAFFEHRSFVLPDAFLDFFRMLGGIRPGGIQVCSGEWNTELVDDLGVWDAGTPDLDE